MQQARTILTTSQSIDLRVRDLLACHQAGEDPRRTIRRIDAHIVGCQSAGEDVPASLLRLSRTLTAEWVAQAPGR